MLLPRSPDARWALAWLVGLFIVLALLLAAPRSNGQENTQPGLSENLSKVEQALRELETRLGQRQQQIKNLQALSLQVNEKLTALAASYATLQQELAQAQTSLTESQTALTETLTLLEKSLARFDALEKQWMAYRNETEAVVAGLERDVARARRWAVGFGVATAVGFVVSLVLALR